MIQLPIQPKVVSEDGNKTTFEIGPLYPGYGVTMGNSLRRVLVSSIDGAAVTSIKIKGVDHEFSSVEGVVEDVIELILNLKRVRFKMFSEEPVILTLQSKGQKTITAADIQTTADIEVVNTDQVIATVTDKKTDINMELKIEKGVGYVPVEQRQKEKLGVGSIAVDAIFTPIKSVNYRVENIRVGQRTDYNKVLLDLETDGSISPQEALQRASKILIDYFTIINEVEVPKSKPAKAIKVKVAKKTKKK
ncbi:MAG: DNA-directed RNA polymerase subunit alpha [bacterium]|nr:DNA-directed RNA polymerase subunit alpha [bacterium]